MSRITGREVASLMEAYNAVYAPQEEIVDENLEQIDEQGGRRGSGSSASQTNQSVSLAPIGNAARSAASAVGGAAQRVGSSISQSVSAANKVPTSSGSRNVRGGGTRPAAAPAAAPTQSRFAGARDAAFARARNIQGSPVVGSRPAAPAARPAATAPATDAKMAPAAAPTAARPSLAQQAAELRAMRQRSVERQGGTTVSAGYEPEGEQIDEFLGKAALAAGALYAAGKGMEAMKGAVDKKIDRARKTSPIGGDRRVPQMNSYDMFDVVLEYLVAEGYADTSENALVIMANMSEEWRKNIIERFVVTDLDRKLNTPAYKNYKKGNEKYKPGGEGANKLKEA